MNTGINATLQQIYNLLPLYTEEGNEFTEVDIDDLVRKLSDINSIAPLPSVAIVQRIFSTLGLLDEQTLQRNHWRFVSFPAALMARSVLKSLADTDQSLFAGGFWNQQDSASPVSDQQRSLLHSLESHRVSNHKTNAQPIRYIHVAWGLIVVDGKVLLRHREDKNRANLNNYVLVGGRLSQNDLKKTGKYDNSEHNVLETLQSPFASEDVDAMDMALVRELNEETGLDVDSHYSFKPWRVIKPYTAVEGAGANHALTEYHIHVYHIDLTLDGIFALSKRCEQDENLTWFTLDELEDAKSVDGKMAFIDALVKDYATPKEWHAAVISLEPSYTGAYSLDRDIHAITLPQTPDQPLLYGKTGKEQKLELGLTDEELSLLTSLCLTSKDPSCSVTSTSVTALPDGWLEINDTDVQMIANTLSTKCQQACCTIVEGYKERYYRIALGPDHIYFSDALFSYSLANGRGDKHSDRNSNTGQSKTELILTRGAIETSIISLQAATWVKNLSHGLNAGLEKIEQGKDIEPNDMETLNKSLRRDLGPLCRNIGLRRMVRTISNTPTITITLK